jgi:calcineurin-like phosphoesterase
MKILFIGDIVGKPGRRAVKELLPGIVEENRIDCVIANCENAASGFGVTGEIVDELYSRHIDVLTSGNHIWDKKEILESIDDDQRLLRPANYPPGVPGRGSVVIPTRSGVQVAVLNLAPWIAPSGRPTGCSNHSRKGLAFSLSICTPRRRRKRLPWAGIWTVG